VNHWFTTLGKCSSSEIDEYRKSTNLAIEKNVPWTLIRKKRVAGDEDDSAG
jgi:hypothetical protein